MSRDISKEEVKELEICPIWAFNNLCHLGPQFPHSEKMTSQVPYL